MQAFLLYTNAETRSKEALSIDKLIRVRQGPRGFGRVEFQWGDAVLSVDTQEDVDTLILRLRQAANAMEPVDG